MSWLFIFIGMPGAIVINTYMECFRLTPYLLGILTSGLQDTPRTAWDKRGTIGMYLHHN
jgi:hypothetical protein